MAKRNPIQSSLIMLAIAAVIVALSYFVVAPRQAEKKQVEENSALLYGGLSRDEILSFEFRNESGRYLLSREARDSMEWILNHDEKTYKADREAVTGLISTLVAAKRDAEIETPPLEQVGLENPKFTVTVRSGGEKENRTLQIGNDTPVNYHVYAKWADEPVVFLTTRSIRFGVDKNLKDLRNKKPFDWDFDSLTELDFSSRNIAGLETEKFTVRKSDKGWALEGNEAARIDEAEIKKWFAGFENLKVQGFASDSADEKNNFGLRRPAATLKIKNSSGKTQEWKLGYVQSQVGKNTADKFYLNEEESPTTFEVNAAVRDAFKVSRFQIRDKTVAAFHHDKISRVRLEGKRDFIEFTRDGSSWVYESNLKGFSNGRAKTVAVERLLKDSSQLRATKYHDGTSKWKTGLSPFRRKLQFFENEKMTEEILIGKVVAPTETIVSSKNNPSPAGVLVNFDEVAPIKAELFLERPADDAKSQKTKKAADKKAKTKGKTKMEKTVSSVSELEKLPSAIVKEGHEYSAEITVEGKGKITIKFDSAKAPYTVSNFLHLARNGFYDGLAFHRVIKDFVAQGGDPKGNGTGGPGWIFDYENNDLKHTEGAISMAHAADPNTNGSQFFLVHKPQPHLDGVHTVFGYITSGLDVMYAIEQGDKMEKVEVFEKAI